MDNRQAMERCIDVAHQSGVVAGLARAGEELMLSARDCSLEVREFAQALARRWFVAAEAMHDGSRAMLDQMKDS